MLTGGGETPLAATLLQHTECFMPLQRDTEVHVLSPLLSGPDSRLGSCEAPGSSDYRYPPSDANGATSARIRCKRLQGYDDTPTTCESSYLIMARSTRQLIQEAGYHVGLGKNCTPFQPGEVCATLD